MPLKPFQTNVKATEVIKHSKVFFSAVREGKYKFLKKLAKEKEEKIIRNRKMYAFFRKRTKKRREEGA